MASEKKRKNTDGLPDDHHHKRSRNDSRSTGTPNHQVNTVTGNGQQRTTRRSQKKTPLFVPSTPPVPDMVSEPLPTEPEAANQNEDRYVYHFRDSVYPSFEAPVRGFPTLVEEIIGISYPGEDRTVYALDSGYVVPPNIVHSNDLYNRAFQVLREEGVLSPSQVPPPCGQPPRARSPSPKTPESESVKIKVWPPRSQGIPYVLVPADPYIIKAGHTRPSGKGKERYIQSEVEESSAEDDGDDDFVPCKDYREPGYNDDSTIDDFSREENSDSVEDPNQTRSETSEDDIIVVDQRENCQAAGVGNEGPANQDSTMTLTLQLSKAEMEAMKAFFHDSRRGFEALSAEERVASARLIMQAMVNVISKVDRAFDIFGGLDYVEPGGTVATGLCAVFKSCRSLDQTEEHAVPDLKVEKAKLLFTSSKPVTLPAPIMRVDEESHVTVFKRSDPRKRGRNYLGLTYSKIDRQRVTIDWQNFIPNSIRLQFRLENCNLSPHPGEESFVADKVPPKQWIEIGNMLTADDFHPVDGGCNPNATRFVSWTPEEKRFKKGSREYEDIPIVVNREGVPLLRLRQALLLKSKTEGGKAEVVSSAGDTGSGGANVKGDQSMPQNVSLDRSSAIAPRQETRVSSAKTHEVSLATTPLPGSSKLTPTTGAHRFPSRAPPPPAPPPAQTATKKTQEEKEVQKAKPTLPRAALIPEGAIATSFSRELPRRGELGSGQYKKLINAYPSRPPPVAAATQAFYASSTEPPPSNRGLNAPKPQPRPKLKAREVNSPQDFGPSYAPPGDSGPAGSSKH
ncbi:hypothetical protein CVT26_002232 [Gymnopilus dilepis]|uniref:Uncharacterized protein n=1 Tax=Gymnopilus dilepis TaxID=231916 RepID=A0A409YN61_9AGAR|nr:hypothetical protein CVT26_002232 [Gymnopilus dilepis]